MFKISFALAITFQQNSSESTQPFKPYAGHPGAFKAGLQSDDLLDFMKELKQDASLETLMAHFVSKTHLKQ